MFSYILSKKIFSIHSFRVGTWMRMWYMQASLVGGNKSDLQLMCRTGN
jgi:hypothetical protein